MTKYPSANFLKKIAVGKFDLAKFEFVKCQHTLLDPQKIRMLFMYSGKCIFLGYY